MARPHNRRQLGPKKDDDDDGVIVGEVVNPNLVNANTIEKFAEPGRELQDLQEFLRTINQFTSEQAFIIREHAEKHPDAIDHRKTKHFRRVTYYCLLGVGVLLIGAMPFISLVVAATFGIISMLIICAVLLNARDRELDLSGLLQMIQTVLKKGQ